MVVDHDRRQLWDSFVAPVLFGCWCPHNFGRMAHGPQRPAVDATIFFDGGIALVCHVGRFCFDCARCTVLQQMGANSGGYGGNCDHRIVDGRASRQMPCSNVTVVKPSRRSPLLPQHGCSDTRMTETSSGWTECLAGPRQCGSLAIAPTPTSLSGSAQIR